MRTPMLPIVIVPGIMGSRLAEPGGGATVWDPYAGWGARVALGRIANPAPLVPVATLDNVTRASGLTLAQRASARSVPGLGGIVFEVGGRLALALAGAPFTSALVSRHR